jgi:hypothetical protein
VQPSEVLFFGGKGKALRDLLSNCRATAKVVDAGPFPIFGASERTNTAQRTSIVHKNILDGWQFRGHLGTEGASI